MTTESDAKVVAEIEAMYERYLAEMSASLWRYVTEKADHDMESLDYWIFPILVITNWRGSTDVRIVDRERFGIVNREMYDKNYADGWDGRLVSDELEVKLVSPAMALISSKGSRYRTGGSVLSRWHANYWLRLTASGWKQFGIANPTPPLPPENEWVAWLSAVEAADNGAACRRG